MKCIYVNCKCEASVTLATFWGKNENVGFCDKHLPAWAKSKTIGLLSPEFAGKSFYQIVNAK